MKIILILEAGSGALPADIKKGNANAYRVYTGTGPEGIATAQAPPLSPGGQRLRAIYEE